MIRSTLGMVRRNLMVVAGAFLPVAVQGCSLHRAGRQEVATFVQARAADREADAQTYARAPAAAPAPDEKPGTPEEPKSVDTLRGFIVAALENNPEIKAAEETARAQAEHIVQVTTLPDPMLTTKTLPEPVRTAEGDNFFVLGVSERFPVPGKLDRAGRMALEDARASMQRLQEVRLRVIAEVKRAYFLLYVLDKSIDITQENQRLLRGLIDVARAQVAAGRRPQDDALRAQVELSSLEAELIALRQSRVTIAARLNELLARAPGATVAPPETFGIRQADLSLDQLLAKAADANPALRQLQHQIEREKHAVELAKLEYWPEFTLGFEWMYMKPREAFQPPRDPNTGMQPVVSKMSERGMDNWVIMLDFSLPIWFDKIKGGISEAQHRLGAARQEYAAAQNRIGFQVEDALGRVRAQRDLAALFDGTIIPQAQQTYEVSQGSYIAGTSEFLYVIDNWRKWLAFTIQYHRTLGELERSVADLEEAIGLSLPEATEDPR